jgi:hypothetical protein
MTRMLNCLVSYFALDENDRPEYRRFFCYHIVAGHGPTPDAGVPVITTLAVHNADRSTYCEQFHTVEAGGPAAALDVAFRYLDAYHEHDHLRKVQSRVRDNPTADTVPFPGTGFDVTQGVPTRMG